MLKSGKNSKHPQLFAGKTTNRVREIFSKQGCQRDALNAAFTLSNAHSKDFFLLVTACLNFKLFELRDIVEYGIKLLKIHA